MFLKDLSGPPFRNFTCAVLVGIRSLPDATSASCTFPSRVKMTGASEDRGFLAGARMLAWLTTKEPDADWLETTSTSVKSLSALFRRMPVLRPFRRLPNLN